MVRDVSSVSNLSGPHNYINRDNAVINSPKHRILRIDTNPYTRVSPRRSTSSSDGDVRKALSSDVVDNRPVEERYTHREIISIAMTMSPLWFLANCLYNYSLLKTSVGSSTIIRLVSHPLRPLAYWSHPLHNTATCQELSRSYLQSLLA